MSPPRGPYFNEFLDVLGPGSGPKDMGLDMKIMGRTQSRTSRTLDFGGAPKYVRKAPKKEHIG